MRKYISAAALSLLLVATPVFAQTAFYAASPVSGPSPLTVDFTVNIPTQDFDGNSDVNYALLFNDNHTSQAFQHNPTPGTTCVNDGTYCSVMYAHHAFLSPGTYNTALVKYNLSSTPSSLANADELLKYGTVVDRKTVTVLSDSNTIIASNVQAQIAALLAQIQQLTQIIAQLKQAQSSVSTASPGCFIPANDLWIGKTDAGTNGEVTRLQQWLKNEGYFPGTQEATGHYGTITGTAVMKWQQAHGMDFVDVRSGVGKQTRAKMQEACTVSQGSAPDISRLIQESEIGVLSVLADQAFDELVNESAKKPGYQWLYTPSEVVRKFAAQFGLQHISQLVEGERRFGEGSGLCHTSVAFLASGKEYESGLVAYNCNGPWMIRSITDKNLFDQEREKLQVFGFTEDVDSPRWASDIAERRSSGRTIFMLDTKHPVVSFTLNHPADPASVNSDTVVVKINGVAMTGVVATAIMHKQTSPAGTQFETPKIRVDLSGVPNISAHIGKLVQIILTNKIKSTSGSPLRQCGGPYDKSVRNPGACVTDASGQKIESFGAELELY